MFGVPGMAIVRLFSVCCTQNWFGTMVRAPVESRGSNFHEKQEVRVSPSMGPTPDNNL